MSTDLAGPRDTARISGTVDSPCFSRRRRDSSIESSSKGFIDILTPEVSTAVLAELRRGLTCSLLEF